jgi:uncharacterized protein YdiU (UPF0061 family)
MVIKPEIIVTPDSPVIRIRETREAVNIETELPRILQTQGWGCGTYFQVQFLSHDRTQLLACGDFVVTEETESLQTSEANPYQPMTKTVYSRKFEQIGAWWEKQVPVDIQPKKLEVETDTSLESNVTKTRKSKAA